MYIPKQFEETRADVMHSFIRRHPLATLIVNSDQELTADHIPLTLRVDEALRCRLLGHIANANPLFQKAAGGIDCLAIFHGPQHYISPNGYATKAETGEVVPTWNYEVVHVQGRLKVISDPAGLHRLLDELTREHEGNQRTPWKLNDAPKEYLERLLRAVVGIEIEIISMVGKAKLSQNQPKANQVSLIRALRESGETTSGEMASAVERIVFDRA